MKANTGIRLGRRRVPPLAVPGELFELYQPRIGPLPTLVWLNTRWMAHSQMDSDVEQTIQNALSISFQQLTEAMAVLTEYDLLEIAEDGQYVVHEPLSGEAFLRRFSPMAAEVAVGRADLQVENVGKASRQVGAQPEVVRATVSEAKEPATGVTATAGSPLSRRHRRRADSVEQTPTNPVEAKESVDEGKGRRVNEDERGADMEAVLQIYHNKIGMLGPTQYEKLRFWVVDQGMDGEVVALAIEETVHSAPNPRISYLEGILRNWYNDGIRTLGDLLGKKNASRVLSGDTGTSSGPTATSMEGVANASAYQRVDPALVQKWKELYPDEYDG